MDRGVLAIVLLASAVLLAGCAPSIVVQNNTTIGVRAAVTSGGEVQVLSPLPGESAAAEVDEGSYTVGVIPDRDWVQYATLEREYLVNLLADPNTLTGPAGFDLIARLADITAKIEEYQKAASTGLNSGCAGTVTSEKDGVATITSAADGKLVVSCQ